MSSGLLGSPLETLAALVAACASFQSFSGSSSAAEALPKVFREVATKSLASPSSRAIVSWIEGDLEGVRDSSSFGSGAFAQSVSLTLIFERDFSSLENATAGVSAFRDSVGAVVAEMLQLSGSSSSFPYLSAYKFKGLFLDDKALSPSLAAVWNFSWRR